MSGNGGKNQPIWMRDVKVGSVLMNARGIMRVVREATFYKNGNLRSVTFAIKRCSWTHRPYTVYGFSDLRTFGFKPAHVRVKLSSPLDAQLDHAIHHSSDRSMKCCMVRGMP